ncbi:hypothetical protein CCH79_00005163 [Gambusia affinis]|uniref:Rap guanine nucleotide exchange factor 4 n=1 Tax=Gambusia affinis TaxID=33528 RepID=A0A315VQG6_GAMAF|nr:hypothetical protein CCH79_00005163 [Gambusia affinis]
MSLLLSTVFRQGDIGTSWYAVLSGSLDVKVSETANHQDAVTICTLGIGTAFGESILDNTPRHATIVSRETSELLRIEQREFKTLWEVSLVEVTDSIHKVPLKGGPGSEVDHFTLASLSSPSYYFDLLSAKDSGPDKSKALFWFARSTIPPPAPASPFTTPVSAELLSRHLLLHWSSSVIQTRITLVTCERKCSGSWLDGSEGGQARDRDRHWGDCKYRQSLAGLLAPPYGAMESGSNNDSTQSRLTDKDNLNSDSGNKFHNKVPSEKLQRAGKVLRNAILSRAPHMIRDRKYHLKTYRQCCVGTELVDWLVMQSACVLTRSHAVGMWQVLLEEGVLNHVDQELGFHDKYLFYRFLDDEEEDTPLPSEEEKRESEEELPETILFLAQIGPDALLRMILRKPWEVEGVQKIFPGGFILTKPLCVCRPGQRTADDLEIIYDELLHIKALSHLSNTVKRELASVVIFESHAKAGTVLFNQGEEGTSWYIIQKGSVNVVIYGKGVVCTLHEGDDFGKLALVTDSPRAASIVLREDNCHFLRVDKEDFNRILRDVEANTVRLKEHEQAVLVLEKSHRASTLGSIKYTVISGTPEKILEHFLETMRLDIHHNEPGTWLLPGALTCCSLKELYGSVSNDSRTLRGLKDLVPDLEKVVKLHSEEVKSTKKVYCSDHTYTTIRIPVAATGKEVISAVSDKLGTTEELLLVHLSSAGEKQMLKPNDVSVFSPLSINGRLFACPREQLGSLAPLPDQEGPSAGSMSTFELMSSKDLAYQMTMFDWELFSCVHEHELLYHTFGRHSFRRTTANLDLFLRRFNQVQLWVVTEVCLCTQLSKRVQLLKKFIKIAAHCREFKNLNSFFAIIMGMSNPAVSRLSQTWEKLPSKFKKFYAEFESMMDPSRNHRSYRLTVTKLEPPIIPFMPLLLKDPDICQPNKNQAEVRGYVRKLCVIDNQRALTQLSYRLEPRRT